MQRQEYCEEKMQSLDNFLAEFVGDEDGNFMQNI
jgi:hypothetical protein